MSANRAVMALRSPSVAVEPVCSFRSEALATRQPFFSNDGTSANCRNMSLRQKTFQSIAIDDELAVVARNQMLSLEQTQIFGDSRPRGAG